MLNDTNNGLFNEFAEHPYYCEELNQNPNQCNNNNNNDAIEAIFFSSDEFRMYAYKIRRCTRTTSHDWTDCPYAHRGEKAQRRDPRRVPYCAIACPAFRNGRCYKGDPCEFAHGVFEYWLHPARYRTRPCNAGRFCQRKVCFFAHSPEQLRAEGKIRCPLAYKGRMNLREHHHHHHHHHNQQFITMGSSSGSGGNMVPPPLTSPLPSLPSIDVNNKSSSHSAEEDCFYGVSGFLKSMRGMKIRDDNNKIVEAAAANNNNKKAKNGDVGFEILDSDLPNIDWISDLVQ